MRIVLPGGTGQVGELLRRSYVARGDDVVVLSRAPRADDVAAGRAMAWDGRTLGPWVSAIDGADVVVNLAGRTVNCRYTEENLRQMMDSRVESTRVIGEAIAAASKPPKVWLQSSTATIYAHTFGPPHDEREGVLGGDEPDVPAYWARSIAIALAWEKTLAEAPTPRTRKVALRSSMIMSPDRGGIFDVLLGLTKKGLGGPIAGGRQYMSWIHGDDFVRALDLLVERDDLEGAVNVCAPNPIPQREFMQVLRDASRTRVGLPATKWMVEIGAFFLRTDTELVLKSRRVVPKRLVDAGFSFRFPEWSSAAMDLVDARAHAS